MDPLQVLAPLAGVVLGSVLTGLSGFLKARAERKRTIATALTDLLEVRHQVVGVQTVLEELISRHGMPSAIAPHARTLMESFAPVDKTLHDRYEKAIDTLAGVDPLLAFTMRSKNTLPRALSAMRQFALTSGASPGEYDVLESKLVAAAVPTLDEAVVELARAHSYFTLRKVRQIVGRKPEFPVELRAALAGLAQPTVKSRNGPPRTEA